MECLSPFLCVHTPIVYRFEMGFPFRLVLFGQKTTYMFTVLYCKATSKERDKASTRHSTAREAIQVSQERHNQERYFSW